MQQTQKQSRWYNDKNRIYAGLARSSWVTSITDWFMSFAGKAVELVLYATVLYSCAQLYPGVHLPESLSLAVFLVQMGALDIGGLSLGKLARQAHEDGNDLGAKHARRLSIGLIAIMLVGVATVGIERVIPLPDQVQIGVQLVLVIARSVGSVLYGRVVHDLKPVDGQVQSSDELSEKFTPDITQMLSKQSEELHATIENRVATMQQSLSDLLPVQLEQALMKHHMEASGITATLETHERSITALNALPASIEKALAHIKAELDETLQGLIGNASGSATRPKLSIVGNGVSTSVREEGSASGKKDFVYLMLTTHPEIRNTEIIQEARKQGITITSGYVSQIRKAFSGERTA
jgi:hypothetical protein